MKKTNTVIFTLSADNFTDAEVEQLRRGVDAACSGIRVKKIILQLKDINPETTEQNEEN